MRFSFLSLALAASTVAASYSPFSVYPLTTHQPNGEPDGDTNYYNIQFTVNSVNDGTASATCTAFWGDNSWAQSEAYSLYVPTDQWLPCTGASSSDKFAFQLYPYFSIGNFSLAVQQNFTDASGTVITASGEMHITNTTSHYTCSINGEEVQYVQHAHGDCSIPSNATAFFIPVTKSSAADICTTNVKATFVAAYDTQFGQNILLVGSIPELGSWDPSKAIMLTGSMPNPAPAWPVFTTSVEIPAGTDFEFKYIFQNFNGSETWEAGDNREGSISTYSCADTIIGGDPDDFRAGGYPVESS